MNENVKLSAVMANIEETEKSILETEKSILEMEKSILSLVAAFISAKAAVNAFNAISAEARKEHN